MRLRNIFAALLLALGFFCASAADRSTAADLIERCASAIKSAGAVRMDFTIMGNGGDFRGKITMSGNSFAMVVPGVRVWFDGRTQWTLLEEQSTVNITEPTLDELMESNPFVILSNYSKRYTVRRVEGAPAGKKKVLLTPSGKSEAGVLSATLTLSEKTWLPTEVDITFSNGSEIIASVQSAEKIARPNPAAFRFNPKDYDTTEVVDLR